MPLNFIAPLGIVQDHTDPSLGAIDWSLAAAFHSPANASAGCAQIRALLAPKSCRRFIAEHWETSPHVVRGAALDVAVDLRKNSPTYGQHQKAMLTGENRWQFWVPPGFAHGFATLEEDTVFCYKCTEIYSPEHEQSLRWNDPTLNIEWGLDHPLLSEKDELAPLFSDFDSPFE